MNVIHLLPVAGALVGLLAASASAQVGTQLNDVAPDERLDIIEMVEPRPEVPAANTALTFTNTWPREAKVKLEAYNHAGEPVGRGELVVPANGLKYVFVSRIVADTDPRFIGWVLARTSHPLFASAVLLGLGVTDLPVDHNPRLVNTDAVHRPAILFPLTAAY